jgi:hypothetical protein
LQLSKIIDKKEMVDLLGYYISDESEYIEEIFDDDFKNFYPKISDFLKLEDDEKFLFYIKGIRDEKMSRNLELE